jgi:hypothetical protein
MLMVSIGGVLDRRCAVWCVRDIAVAVDRQDSEADDLFPGVWTIYGISYLSISCTLLEIGNFICSTYIKAAYVAGTE